MTVRKRSKAVDWVAYQKIDPTETIDEETIPWRNQRKHYNSERALGGNLLIVD
jgi:hypothetical protein